MSSAEETGMENAGKKHRLLSEAQILLYLEGKLQGDELREAEELMGKSGMEHDALEGLKELQTAEIRLSTARINKALRKKLKLKRKRKAQAGPDFLTVVALVTLLLLCVIAYIVIRKSL